MLLRGEEEPDAEEENEDPEKRLEAAAEREAAILALEDRKRTIGAELAAGDATTHLLLTRRAAEPRQYMYARHVHVDATRV